MHQRDRPRATHDTSQPSSSGGAFVYDIKIINGAIVDGSGRNRFVEMTDEPGWN